MDSDVGPFVFPSQLTSLLSGCSPNTVSENRAARVTSQALSWGPQVSLCLCNGAREQGSAQGSSEGSAGVVFQGKTGFNNPVLSAFSEVLPTLMDCFQRVLFM